MKYTSERHVQCFFLYLKNFYTENIMRLYTDRYLGKRKEYVLK